MTEHDVTAEDDSVEADSQITPINQEQCERILGSVMNGLVTAGASVEVLRRAFETIVSDSATAWKLLEISEGLRDLGKIQVHTAPLAPEDIVDAINNAEQNAQQLIKNAKAAVIIDDALDQSLTGSVFSNDEPDDGQN